MRFAVMQPYFLPYAGYFRLFAGADVMVMYDCVQFPRRSWVHRNKLLHKNGRAEWLTLPLKKAPQSARINALAFSETGPGDWPQMLEKFPCFFSPSLAENGLSQSVAALKGSPKDYIANLLKQVCEELRIPCNAVFSSSFNLPETLAGQDRIMAIAQHLGAKTYVNSPGGRALYDGKAFSERGLELRFLAPYEGSMLSIAQRLADEPASDVRAELMRQLTVAE